MLHSGMEDEESDSRPCDVCGKPAVVVIEAVAWCASCFHEMGSCCGEWHETRDGEDTPAPPGKNG